MRRATLAIAATLLALTSALAGRTHGTMAANTFNLASFIPHVTVHNGDFLIFDAEAYRTGPDLTYAIAVVSGPALLGGSVTSVTAECVVFRNYNPNAVPNATETDVMTVSVSAPAPPGAFEQGYGHVSGPDVSPASTSVYAAMFASALDTAANEYLVPIPGNVQANITNQGWLHFNNTLVPPHIGTRYPDSGTTTITMRGIEERIPAVGPTTFSPGALQCQIGNQTPDFTVFSEQHEAFL